MACMPQWEKFSTGAEVAATFADRIYQKTIIVTGANPLGLGAATAKAIASHEPKTLILTYRSVEKAQPLPDELKSIAPRTEILGVTLDLANLQSCREAAARISQSIDHLDILINNAGTMSVQERLLTDDGIELSFATNHVGPFLFTNLLMSKILAAASKNPSGATRIVNVLAGWHHFSPVRFDDYTSTATKYGFRSEGVYLPEAAYGQSKTANILCSVYLTEHLHERGILSFANHPGGILTEIGRSLPKEMVDKIDSSGLLDKSPENGASTTLIAALGPRLNAESPSYINDGKEVTPAAFASDPIHAARLWKLSEKLVGQQFPL